MRNNVIPGAGFLALSIMLALPTGGARAGGWSSEVVPAKSARPQAQTQPGQPRAQRMSAKPAAQPQALPQQPLTAQVQFLLRTTLLALNDANRTGNYSVLRDLAAPSLRERASAADLAQVFAQMRRNRLDLSMAAILSPELEEQPVLDADRRLRLKGSYPTEPNRIAFEVVYEAVAGHWQLHGIAISTRPSRTAAGGPMPPAR